MSGRGWVRRYDLAYPEGATAGSPGQWLATVVLTHDGHLFAHSDFGDWGHWWRGSGADFRGFLARVTNGQVLYKIARGRAEYDGKATAERLRESLDGALADGDITAEDHAARLEEMAEHEDLATLRDFYLWQNETDQDDVSEYVVDSPPRDAVLFVEHVMPALRAALAEEIANERGAAVTGEGGAA